MKFVKRIGAAALAACMVLSCVGCGSSSNKGAAEGTHRDDRDWKDTFSPPD